MTEAFFEGHQPRDCGEHRTLGSVRAWCFDCGEYCYPGSPCIRCEAPRLRALLAAAEAVVNEWTVRGDHMCGRREMDALIQAVKEAK